VATSKSKPAAHATTADTTKAVDAFMSTLDHVFKKEIQAIRSAILSVDAKIAEGVKWNAPSFRTTDYFATTNLREKNGVGIILHLGAKVRKTAAVTIDDPSELLKWLAKDRAMIVFKDLQEFSANKAAFKSIIRSWIDHV
jgi:hypothetical protein